MILERHLLFLKMIFQWRHDILSEPGVEVSTHFWMAELNSNLENEFQIWRGLNLILFRISTLTWRLRAVLNELWKAFHRISGELHGEPLYLMASVAGSFLFLTQFISSQGPLLLFAISLILLSKNNLLVLQSMPHGVNMDMGRGYDDNDRLHHSGLS